MDLYIIMKIKCFVLSFSSRKFGFGKRITHVFHCIVNLTALFHSLVKRLSSFLNQRNRIKYFEHK